jgi:hypothetical protein
MTTAQVCGVCGAQAELGRVFCGYFGFPIQSFHRFLHINSSSSLSTIQGWHNRSGRQPFAPPQEPKKKKLYFLAWNKEFDVKRGARPAVSLKPSPCSVYGIRFIKQYDIIYPIGSLRNIFVAKEMEI